MVVSRTKGGRRYAAAAGVLWSFFAIAAPAANPYIGTYFVSFLFLAIGGFLVFVLLGGRRVTTDDYIECHYRLGRLALFAKRVSLASLVSVTADPRARGAQVVFRDPQNSLKVSIISWDKADEWTSLVAAAIRRRGDRVVVDQLVQTALLTRVP